VLGKKDTAERKDEKLSRVFKSYEFRYINFKEDG